MESMGIDRDVLKEDYFELAAGRSLKNLSELNVALGEMDDETFSQYVSKHHNDFGDWILEAYDEEKLAKKIGKIKKRAKMRKVLRKVLKKEGVEKLQKIVAPRNKKEVLNKLGEMKNEM